jgi:hypothetical protein
MKEIWKHPKGFEETHMVSNYGRVRHYSYTTFNQKYDGKSCVSMIEKCTMTGPIIRPIQNMYGEPTIMGKTCDRFVGPMSYKETNIKYTFHSVAKMIASAFVENPNDYKHLHFKNGVRTSVQASNLEWVEFGGRSEFGALQPVTRFV